MSRTLWVEGSKSSGQEGGHRTGQSLMSVCFYNIFNSFSYLSFSKILSLIDFTFLSFRPGTSLGKGNSSESQLLTGMFYHCLLRQTGAYTLGPYDISAHFFLVGQLIPRRSFIKSKI